MDGNNLTAEHLQLGVTSITKFLTPTINSMLKNSTMPQELNDGITHPIQKKGKVKGVAGNHRGITISPVITKVYDKISLTNQNIMVERDPDDQQYGFSNGRSGLLAAFILNEAIADSVDSKTPLYVASLDVMKAFDVVRHESLLDKLYNKGLTGAWWRMKDASYQNLTTRVIWDGRLSNPIHMKQGNRQGAFPSPSDYVTYIADQLSILEGSHLGYNIGGINLVSPTCADDMLIMSRSILELQTLLQLAATYANEEHFTIHPEKTVIIPVNIQSKAQFEHLQENSPWEINGNRLPVKKELIHIGFKQELVSIAPTIEDRVSNGRKCVYGLLGSGMHGVNGLPVPVSCHMYKVFVIPCTTYGLEILLTKPNVNTLESFQRTILRCLLGVPERTAIPSLYIITGILPMKYHTDQKHLSFLHSLISKEGRLKDLVERQSIMKTSKSKSWIPNIKDILQQYSLPLLPDLLEYIPPKDQWKKTLKDAILQVTEEDIEEQALSKSTLKYLCPRFTHNKCHNVVSFVKSPREVTRACIKTRMLTGTYPLQTTRLTYRQVPNDICPLCGVAPEDLTHCLLECTATQQTRAKYMPTIMDVIPHINPNLPTILHNREKLTHLLMDCSHPAIVTLMKLSMPIQEKLERKTRNMCYAIHIDRTNRLACL